MTQKKMTQSEIEALINDSDLESSALQDSNLQSQIKQKSLKQSRNSSHRHEESNQYGGEQFEDFEQSKRTEGLNRNIPTVIQGKTQKSSIYDSYANEEFDSYDESKRTKQFERSQQNTKFTKKSQAPQLKPIQQYATNKTVSQKSNIKPEPQKLFEKSGHQPTKSKQNNLIFPSNQKPKYKTPFITPDTNENKNLPHNYNRLQQRQKQLLLTSLTEENKKLRQIISQKDKQLSSVKGKYNILLEQKAQVLGNAKQATLRKQLQQLQSKYDALLKQKAKQRAYKSVVPMSKTMNNNFVSQAEAEEREEELMIIIQKLKQRLVSTDKQLKTLQQKMNEGLDYQEELQRKLKRVEQLQLRMEKMKNQAEQDRALIEMLKQKTKEQKNVIEELKQEKNELNLCLKRAQMTQVTQSDLKEELEEARREKQLLQKSLRQISLNFSSNLAKPNKKQSKSEPQDIIEDSNELLSYKK